MMKNRNMSCLPIDPATSRVETITGALLYLMTAYQRNQCPRIAVVIARHLECLARHPNADPVVREVCECLGSEWHKASQNEASASHQRRVH
jgi:hypothetical protein